MFLLHLWLPQAQANQRASLPDSTGDQLHVSLRVPEQKLGDAQHLQPAALDESHDVSCDVCLTGGELQRCHKCPRRFHLTCHVPTLHKPPRQALSGLHSFIAHLRWKSHNLCLSCVCTRMKELCLSVEWMKCFWGFRLTPALSSHWSMFLVFVSFQRGMVLLILPWPVRARRRIREQPRSCSSEDRTGFWGRLRPWGQTGQYAFYE